MEQEEFIHSHSSPPPAGDFLPPLTPVNPVQVPVLRLQGHGEFTAMSPTGLDTAALERFRRLLLDMKRAAAAAVDVRLHGHGEHRHDEAGLPLHKEETDDDAAAETQRQADLTHLARSATALSEIESALARIDEGEYGLCIDCEEPIDLRRLQAHPAALRCARCQQLFETRRQLSGGRG
jgi:RNA polymerase-binding protein DksA